MWNEKRIGALLLMGGVGQRFGSEMPKQFHRLAGKALFLHALDTFLAAHVFDEIVLCCPPAWIEQTREHVGPSRGSVQIVGGGATRQESSHRGLKAFLQPPDIVVIHDAVRPFVSQEMIMQNVARALETGAVDTCIPSTDTLVYAPDQQTIQEIPRRADYLRGQTPQTFSYPLILRAHEESRRTNASDDCTMVHDLGHPISVVRGDECNLKVTSELDLSFAEQILRCRHSAPVSAEAQSLANRRYVIVGGTGGIGAAIAWQIVQLGGEALSVSRTTHPFSLDLADPDSIERAFCKIRDSVGPFDGLINCAGSFCVAPLERLSLEEISHQIDVNLKGLILCCKLAHLKKGAHVINLASSSYSRGRENTGIYSSAKAGVVNFTQGWTLERPDLHIHTVVPQRTNTSMRRKNFPDEDASSLLDPKTVATAVVNLLQRADLTGLLVEVKKS